MKQHFLVIIDDNDEYPVEAIKEGLRIGFHNTEYEYGDIEVYPVKSVQITESKKND